MKIIILAAPKKFIAQTKILQDNAIDSWIRLVGKENVCLFGDDETKENSARNGIFYEKPETNENGLPLINSIFKIAREKFTADYFLYLNSDIILLSDFIDTAKLLKCRFKSDFFLIGRRTNLDINTHIDFSKPDTENRLRKQAQMSGKLVGATAIDYFLFPRYAFQTIPPLRIGRAGYDNILIYWAKKYEKISVIDGTGSILAIHQNHDYNHVRGGEKEVFSGKDAQDNLKTVGIRERIFLITESDYKINNGKIVSNRNINYYLSKRYLLEVLPALHPILYPLVLIRKKIVAIKTKFKYDK